MERSPNYDDLAGFKTPTKRRIKGKLEQLLADIKRPDAVVDNGISEQQKALYVELDATYQNRIKDFGTSIYNSMQGIKFNYNYIDYHIFRENLTTMKVKLRNFLFDIEPNEEERTEQIVSWQSSGEHLMNSKRRNLLSDYAKIKQKISGNMEIAIREEEYPIYKNTIDYMIECKHIAEINVDFSNNHLYFKQPFFDYFMEIIMTREPEKESIETTYRNKKVFIVHGHATQTLQKVELMIHRIGLQPIILKMRQVVIEPSSRKSSIIPMLVFISYCMLPVMRAEQQGRRALTAGNVRI